jgi:hypothetical protein
MLSLFILVQWISILIVGYFRLTYVKRKGIEYKGSWGCHIKKVIEGMIETANFNNKLVYTTFNGVKLVIHPNDSFDRIYEYWDRESGTTSALLTIQG